MDPDLDDPLITDAPDLDTQHYYGKHKEKNQQILICQWIKIMKWPLAISLKRFIFSKGYKDSVTLRLCNIQ
jgi:hypothetical protein